MSNKEAITELRKFLLSIINEKKTGFEEKPYDIIRRAKTYRECWNTLIKEYGISLNCAVYAVSFLGDATVRDFLEGNKVNFSEGFLFTKLYNSARGKKALAKLCKTNHLNKLNHIDFIKNNKSKIMANPNGLYKLILKTYPERGYTTNMKLVKQIYFESFKLA